MSDVRCQQCTTANPVGASFCARCGAALAPASALAPVGDPAPVMAGPPGGAPSGWSLAVADMARAAPDETAPGAPLRSRECAGWWQRLGASVLDGLVLGLVLIVVFGVAGVLTYAVAPDLLTTVAQSESLSGPEPDGTTSEPTDEEFVAIGVLFGGSVLLLLVVQVLWDVLFVRSRMMAKPGQAICGFRVVRADDLTRLGTGRAVGRAAARGINQFPYLSTLVVIATAFTIGLSSRRQALHDMMAGTACVRDAALRRRGLWPLDATGAAPGLASPPPPPPAWTSTPVPPPPPPAFSASPPPPPPYGGPVGR